MRLVYLSVCETELLTFMPGIIVRWNIRAKEKQYVVETHVTHLPITIHYNNTIVNKSILITYKTGQMPRKSNYNYLILSEKCKMDRGVPIGSHDPYPTPDKS